MKKNNIKNQYYLKSFILEENDKILKEQNIFSENKTKQEITQQIIHNNDEENSLELGN